MTNISRIGTHSKPKANRLSLGVVGCGVMGANHARLLSELKGVELAAVADINSASAHSTARRYGCAAYQDYREMADKVDAVCLAVPTSIHSEVASFFIERQIPFLIEKPLAAEPAESRVLAKQIEESGLTVLVGHIERFNPAFVQLANILDNASHFIAMDIQRLSYASSRITDVDVVSDLMIHDIDIVLSLLKNDQIVSIQSCGYGRDPYSFDYVTTILRSQMGKIFTLTASRITPNKLREIHATTDSSYIKVDLIDQNIIVQHRGHVHISDRSPSPHYSIELGVERVVVRHDEPLANELRHFVDCVNFKKSPLVSARDGLAAVEMAYKIKEQARTNFSISPPQLIAEK